METISPPPNYDLFDSRLPTYLFIYDFLSFLEVDIPQNLA